MDPIAIDFWGGYFGIAVVAFFAGAIPWAQGLRRVAVLTSAAPLLNGAYVVAALGWFPGGTDLNLRLQAALALHNSLALSALLLLMLRTRYHLYYTIDLARGEVFIRALWHTSRGDGPPIR